MTGIECKPVPVEITYGLERLCMFVQEKSNVFDLNWNNDGVKYKEVSFKPKKNFLLIILNLQIQMLCLQILNIVKTNVNVCLEKNSHYQLMINV